MAALRPGSGGATAAPSRGWRAQPVRTIANGRSKHPGQARTSMRADHPGQRHIRGHHDDAAPLAAADEVPQQPGLPGQAEPQCRRIARYFSAQRRSHPALSGPRSPSAARRSARQDPHPTRPAAPAPADSNTIKTATPAPTRTPSSGNDLNAYTIATHPTRAYRSQGEPHIRHRQLLLVADRDCLWFYKIRSQVQRTDTDDSP
jgi:hypothetical protein